MLDGEIHIISSDPNDNEDTCIVKVTKVYYVESHDLRGWPQRV
jgi:hypothetical protein